MKSHHARLFLLLVVILNVLCAIPRQANAEALTGSPAPVKATWIWYTEKIKDSALSILDTCTAKGIKVVFLQINRDVKVSDYRKFIKAAGERGIGVHALDGKPEWGFTSSRPAIETFLNWVKTYQAGSAVGERFTGIHIDVEPYVLPGWFDNTEEFIPQWQDNVRFMVREAHRMQLPIGVDLPFWLHKYTVPESGESLSRWMIRKHDSVTILAFRDSAYAIGFMASKLLEQAADIGIPAMVAVETLPSREGGFITFYEEGRSYMNGQLEQLASLLSHRYAFRGIAVHQFEAWEALKP